MDGAVNFDAWGDVVDSSGAVQPTSIESNSLGTLSPADMAAWNPVDYSGGVVTQSPPSTSGASGSWTALASGLPQYAQSAVDAVKAGFGLSLAKDQLTTQNSLARLGLQQSLLQAQTGAAVAGYRAQSQIAGAQAQAQFASLLSNPITLIMIVGAVILIAKAAK